MPPTSRPPGQSPHFNDRHTLDALMAHLRVAKSIEDSFPPNDDLDQYFGLEVRGQVQRRVVEVFVDFVGYDNLAALMRDPLLRQEFSQLLEDLPQTREALNDKAPLMLHLIDLDHRPPSLGTDGFEGMSL